MAIDTKSVSRLIAEFIKLQAKNAITPESFGYILERLADQLDNFKGAYCGEWDSEEAFARHIVDECYDLERSMATSQLKIAEYRFV